MILSPDNLLITPEGVYLHTPDRLLWAWREVMRLAQEARSQHNEITLLCGVAGAGKSTWLAQNARPDALYLDVTNGRRKDRIETVQNLREMGYVVHIIYVKTSLKTCLDRQANRAESRRVPEKRIQSMYHSLRAYPPVMEEGYQTIQEVSGE